MTLDAQLYATQKPRAQTYIHTYIYAKKLARLCDLARWLFSFYTLCLEVVRGPQLTLTHTVLHFKLI